MDCHCKDHLPGEWHSHEDCDCSRHEFPTHTFVITKVMEEDPGIGMVYISKMFMENLKLSDGDPVELVGQNVVVQARSHPNPWVDTRMVSLDRQTMEKAGLRVFGQIKIRKTACSDSNCVTLEVPGGASITGRQLRSMVERAEGVVLTGRENVTMTCDRGQEVCFRIVSSEDGGRISRSTRVQLVDCHGEDYVCTQDTTFDDVGGLQDAVRKVKEIVQLPLKHPEIFKHLGIDPPRGVLLYGPSGTGKTLIARAVAGETGCYFKAISGTEIMDKYYGESEAKLRAAFDDAYKNSPAIIFIDEIDALAPRRDNVEGEVERRVTAQLLALMDGLEDRGAVVVIAATNLPNLLDSALRRPGRFDREILIGVPDLGGRKEILQIHTRNMPLGDVDLEQLSEKIHGFVGADIRALCREAAFNALRRILPGLEDTDEELSQDFLDAIKIDAEDFDSAFKDMKPASGRHLETRSPGAGWEGIAGYKSEIEYLKEMVLWPLQNSELLSMLEISRPSGILITGPSGIGKTLMAGALARESGFNFIEIRVLELISKYMGDSEKSVREIFRSAAQMAPTVLVLDGLESLRSSEVSDSKLTDRIVSQIATEMNNMAADKPVLVVGLASGAEQVPAELMTTGGFGNTLNLKLPDLSCRTELFKKFLTKGKSKFTGEIESIAKAATGLSCRDVEQLCKKTQLTCLKRQLDESGAAPSEILIHDHDILKALEAWRLSETG